MGKIKSDYPEGNFSVRTKPNEKGDVAIYIVYNVNSRAIPRSTGVRVPIADWDEKKQNVKVKNPDSGRLNHQLKLYRDEIDRPLSALHYKP